MRLIEAERSHELSDLRSLSGELSYQDPAWEARRRRVREREDMIEVGGDGVVSLSGWVSLAPVWRREVGTAEMNGRCGLGWGRVNIGL